MALRWADVVSKRLLSRLAWRRKRSRHVKAVLDAIIADILRGGADHLAITGDLTNFSTPEEFEAAQAWLAGLGDPVRITVSPGNHDALVGHDASPDFRPLRPWLGDPGGAGFPYLRVRGPVAIVNLSSAGPTRVHLAQGTLGSDQVVRAEAMLRETGEAGLYRVVLLHHPLAAGVVARRKALTDADGMRAALGRAGAELVLHGHAHEALLNVVPGPHADVPVIGVPSASTPAGLPHDQAARWNEIDIERHGAAFQTRVTAREITANLGIVTTGQFILS